MSTAKKGYKKVPAGRLYCDEVEKYVDKAIGRLEQDLNLRIDAIDKRDAEQYKMARALYEEMMSKQDELKLEHTNAMGEMKVLAERQARIYEDFVPELREGLNRIHSMIDTHITDETQQFVGIRGDVAAIKDTLDNVSANGNKGLSASLTDVYIKLQEVQKITEGVRARKRFWQTFGDMINNTPLLKPMKSRWGIAIYVILAMLVVNTILHPFGLSFELGWLFKWIVKLVAAS